MRTTARKQDITKSSFIKNYAWYGIQSREPEFQRTLNSVVAYCCTECTYQNIITIISIFWSFDGYEVLEWDTGQSHKLGGWSDISRPGWLRIQSRSVCRTLTSSPQ